MLMLAILLDKGYANAGHSPELKVMIMLAILQNKRLFVMLAILKNKRYANAGHSSEQKVMLMLDILRNKRL
jgi:hypothetical protein